MGHCRSVRVPATAGLVFFLSMCVYAINISLTMKEKAGVARTGDIVNTGVPLPEGAVMDMTGFSLLQNGTPIDAQFEPLSWWHDGSIRWVLAIFKADIAAHGQNHYTLHTNSGSGVTGISAEKNGHSITVNTGAVKFTVSTTAFNLFDSIWVDKNSDHSFTPDETVLSSSLENGPVVVHRDTDIRHTASRGAVKTVVVEENGPMQVCIKVTGTHNAPSGGISDGMYDYMTRIYAYKNSGRIRVVHTIKNSRPPSDNEAHVTLYPAQSYSLDTKFKFANPLTYIALGETAATGSMTASDSLAIFQGGDGSDAWVNPQPGVYWQQDTVYSQNAYPCRGYKIIKNGSTVQSGDRAWGYIDLSDTTWGVTVGMREFPNLFPISMEAIGDGCIKACFWPARYNGNKWMPYLMNKTYEVYYDFHTGTRIGKTVRDFALTAWRPMHALATPAHIAATHAMDGEFFDAQSHSMGVVTGSAADYFVQQDTAYVPKGWKNGWQYYGWEFGQWEGNNHGASGQMWPRIFSYLQSEGEYYGLFERVEAFAMHTRDIRRWHIDNIRLGTDSSIYMVEKNNDRSYDDIRQIFCGSKCAYADVLYSYPDGHGEYTSNFGWDMNLLDPINGDVEDRDHGGMYQLLEYYYLTGDRKSRDAFAERVQLLGWFGGGDNRANGFYLNDAARYASIVNPDSGGEQASARALIKRHLRGWVRRGITTRYGIISNTGPTCAEFEFDSDIGGGKCIMGTYEQWLLCRDPDALDILTAYSRWMLHKHMVSGGSIIGCTPVYTDNGITASQIGEGFDESQALQAWGAAYLATGDTRFLHFGTMVWNTWFSYLTTRLAPSLWNTLGTGYMLPAGNMIAHQRTDTLPPEPVSDLKAYFNEDHTGIYLAWTAPWNNNEKVRRYQVKYFDHSGISEWKEWSNRGKLIVDLREMDRWVSQCSTSTHNWYARYPADSVYALSLGLPNKNWWSSDVDTASYFMTYNAPIFEQADEIVAPGQPQTYYIPVQGLHKLTVSLEQASFVIKSFDAAENISAMSNVTDTILPYQPGLSVQANREPVSIASISVFPNPANPAVNFTIRYTGGSTALLALYDLKGSLVREFPLTLSKTASEYKVTWDGIDKNGVHAATGMYVARLKTGNFMYVKKILWLK